jgi:hypothetical protein
MNDWITTIVLSVGSLVLGLPFAIAATVLNSNWVPHIILDSKTINTGPGKTTKLEFGLLTGPNDTIYAGAYVFIASTALFIIGFVLFRHSIKHNSFGWLAFGPALLNLLSQIGCCAAAYIFTNKYPVATSTNQIRYDNGTYDTGGALYTREAWACSLNALYAEREGAWADGACSRFVRIYLILMATGLMIGQRTARALTLPLVACAACLLGIASWQILQQGGFGGLFGRRDAVVEVDKSTGEYIDLQGRQSP